MNDSRKDSTWGSTLFMCENPWEWVNPARETKLEFCIISSQWIAYLWEPTSKSPAYNRQGVGIVGKISCN